MTSNNDDVILQSRTYCWELLSDIILAGRKPICQSININSPPTFHLIRYRESITSIRVHSLFVLLDLWYGTMYCHAAFISKKSFLSWWVAQTTSGGVDFLLKFQCLTFQITPTTLPIPMACNSNLFKTTPSMQMPPEAGSQTLRVHLHWLHVLDLRQFVGSLRL